MPSSADDDRACGALAPRSAGRCRHATTPSTRTRSIVFAAAMLMLTGCTAPLDPAASTPAATAPEEADIAQTFTLDDGRAMYLECTGSGSPTVVLLSGQRGSADDWKIVADGVSSPSVWSLVADDTRVCAYDRPGTPVGEQPSRSDPVPQPADAQSMADDLNALLAAAAITEPVVLAAHSAGGLVARQFAAEHPESVAGMVLIDVLSDGLRTYMTPEQWAMQKPLLRGDIDESLLEYPALEWIDADTSFDQLQAAPPLPQMPLIVLSADEPIGPTIPALKAAGVVGPEIPDDFGYVTDAAQAKSQADLAALAEGSIHITDTDSGHNVHHEQPALVAEAILDVVARVQAGAATAR
jgi:pimeloyl-ACP methyl ester carboxylesterase